jgi:type II secretory pathway component GspD/PulD (secretin)
MQITVEARFLAIESDFLEQIGFDLDFIFNRISPSHTSTIPVNVDTFSHGAFDPTTGQPTLDANGQPTINQIVGSADIFSVGRPSMIVAGSFFSDLETDFFLQATQAHQQTSRLNALRVTLMNGHEAYVLVETQTDYVSNLTPSVATGIASFQPTIGQLIKGVSFGVRATVTADRKYVIMTVYPTLRNDSLAGTFRFQSNGSSTAASTGSATAVVTNPVTINNNPYGYAQAPDAEIQLREAAIQEVRTTVMVPDKGTLVLGGQRTAAELEIETGVPILSKIPIIKNAFTTRTYVKQETTLLILIRPQILIPEELEP